MTSQGPCVHSISTPQIEACGTQGLQDRIVGRIVCTSRLFLQNMFSHALTCLHDYEQQQQRARDAAKVKPHHVSKLLEKMTSEKLRSYNGRGTWKRCSFQHEAMLRVLLQVPKKLMSMPNAADCKYPGSWGDLSDLQAIFIGLLYGHYKHPRQFRAHFLWIATTSFFSMPSKGLDTSIWY